MKSGYRTIIIFSFLMITKSIQFIYCQPEKIAKEDSTFVLQKDILDIFQKIISKESSKDSAASRGDRPSVSVLPAVGYQMHTGITGVIAVNATFNADAERERNSRILINGNYSQFHQYWFKASSNIFLEKLKLQLAGDVRYYKFPTQTYGLGTQTPYANPLQIDYSYLRFYQVAFHEIAANLFFGIGFNLDYHWNIKVDSVPGEELDQFLRYQQGSKSISSGISLNFLFDSRKNVVNPKNGYYLNFQYRPNPTFLGSGTNWQAFLIDLRHYIRLPASSHNILALWSYNNITVSGDPPYLDLPSIGWDAYSNTGRGYPAGRYTGRNLLYLESEYRFGLTRNGLLGGVIFANAETLSESSPGKEHSVIPAGGFGLRIKINKYSDTNLCVDYSFGIRGSNGIIFNIGEVF